jgi:hypothetical protein
MTDIARKRAFTQITKDTNIKPKTAPSKPLKKEKKQDKQKKEEGVDSAGPKDNEEDFYAFDGTLSLFNIATSQPSRLKKVIDE